MNPKYLKRSYSAVADGVMATKHMRSAAYVDLMDNTLLSDGVEPVGSKAWFIRNGIRLVNHLHTFYTSFIADQKRSKIGLLAGMKWLPSTANRRARRLTDY